MKKLLQINPVLRASTSTGRIMQEIGELAIAKGWESHIAYSKGRDGIKPCRSQLIPIGDKLDVALHGLATRLFDRHGLASSAATKLFIDRIDAIAPDVIHIHNLHGYFINYRLLFDYLSQRNIPVVWTVHDCWLYTGHCFYYSSIGCDKWQNGCGHCPQRGEFPASWFIDRSAANYRDKQRAFTSIPNDRMVIVTVSQWMKSEMSHSFLGGAPFRVIHNGINTELFHPSADDSVKAKYNLSGKHILLGVASVWSKEKGIDDFIALSKRLNADEVILLVGVGKEIQEKLPANIVGISRTENIGELAKLYSAATAFVNPTWQDNYPTVNLEAIACGTPVVTYRTGGSIESVTPATGFIVEQGDVDGIVHAVRQIEQRGKQSYVAPCRAHALENFRKEDRYADYFGLYEELMNRG